jgi:hypothetical protein
MPKRKLSRSFVAVPKDSGFAIQEGRPTGFYLEEGTGGVWIHYAGLEGNQPDGLNIPSTNLMRDVAKALLELADQIDRHRHLP